MSNIRRTANGQTIDMDRLRLANETTIAIGNTRTNARGDLLGAGGQIVKTRAQIQQEYYALHTPMADNSDVVESIAVAQNTPVMPTTQPVAVDTPVVESTNYVKPRGSFAEAIAGETEIKQELLDPAPNKSQGVKRI